MGAREKDIMRKFIAFLIIVALTMIDFVLIGIEAISYATDVLSTSTELYNQNVTFDIYFKDQQGKKVLNKEENIENSNIKLYGTITVKHDGYFDGAISIEKSNFKLKNKILNNSINKIEDNKIIFNKINCSETIEFEVEIEPIKSDILNIDSLSMISEFLLKGSYSDGQDSNIEIEQTKQIQLILANPYTELEGMELKNEIITNKVYEINGENKRIVQVLVQSGLVGNRYPIKEDNIEINVPNGVERVEVKARDILVSNGKEETEFQKSDWNYTQKEAKVNISIKNENKDGTIKWIKKGNDKVVITYILDEKSIITGTDITAKGKITLYDTKNTVKEGFATSKIEEEKDGIVTEGVETEEQSIYKGKIYSGENRNYKVTNKIYANKPEVKKTANVTLNQSIYELEEGEILANTQYINTVVKKSDLERILGTEGKIKILTTNAELITEITNESIPDENGNIIVTYPEGIQALIIETTEIKQAGTISLINTKTIKNDENSREIKRTYKALKEKVGDKEARILLSESETSLKLDLNKTSWSTLEENENIEMIVTLKSDNEKYDLYKNPVVSLYLPQEIEDINVTKFNKIYADEMKIEYARLYPDEKRIEVKLNGEQKEYKSNFVEGIKIVINANIKIKKTEASKIVKIKTVVNNENCIPNEVYTENEIHLNSKYGALLYESIEGHNNESNKVEAITDQSVEAALDKKNEAKQATMKASIVNNYEQNISNVVLLGNIPNSEDKNVINTNLLDVILTEKPGAKIYYLTKDSEKWTENIENIKDVKMFKIEIDTLEPSESVNISYPILIPENIQTNTEANETINLNYNYFGQSFSTSSNIKLTAPVLEVAIDESQISGKTYNNNGIVTNIVAITANKELHDREEISNGQPVSYSVKITNNTGSDLNNLKLVDEHTNVIYYGQIEKEGMYYEQDNTDILIYTRQVEDLENITKTVNTLKSGETTTFKYEFVPNKEKGDEVSGIIKISADNLEEQQLQTITNQIKYAELGIDVENVHNDNMTFNEDEIINFAFCIKNYTKNDIENVLLKVKVGNLKYDKNFLEEDVEVIESEETEDSIEVKIPKLAKNKTTIIELPFRIKAEENTEEINIMNVYYTATVGENTYYSNTLYREYKRSNAKITGVQTANIESDTVKLGDKIIYTAEITNNDSILNLKNVRIDHVISGGNSKIEKAYFIDENSTLKEISNIKRNEAETFFDINAGKTIKYIAEVSIEKDLEYNFNFSNKATSNISLDYGIGKNFYFNEISKTIEIEEEQEESPYDPNYKDDINNQDDTDTNDENTSNNSDEPSNTNNQGSQRDYNSGSISGVAWKDNNKNGIKDDNEYMNGMPVYLVDSKTGQVLNETTTNENGEYSFKDLSNYTYIIAFKYDKSKYQIAQFKADGASNEQSSSVIEKGDYAISNDIEINGNSVYNINAGFIEIQKFDLSINKAITKVVTKTNKGTKAKQYNNQQLVKTEINRKEIAGAVVTAEYTIKVTNEGEIAGYANRIIDYLPKDMIFNAQSNIGWSKSNDGIIYNDSLTNTIINPGESQEVTLVLTKQMTESNTGIIINQAEIGKSSNELDINDIDSVVGNKKDGEDDISGANLIISISTGVTTIIILAIITLIILTIVGVIIYKKKRRSIVQ